MTVDDPGRFAALVRLIHLLISLLWFYALWRWRRRAIALAGLLMLVLLAWLGSSYPLERLYGLQVPGDRVRNLSWCMAVAAGNSPLGTGVVGQVSLEPFWANLVGALSLFSPERVLALYPFLSLGVMIALTLALYYHFGGESSASRGLVVAYFVLLLSTAPLDFLGPYRTLWARMFLLKPNHALGLVFIPLVVGSLAMPGRLGWLRSGLLLGLLSWVFVVHWAFLCFAIILGTMLRFFLDRAGSRRESWPVIASVGLSLAFALPILHLIGSSHPLALTLAPGSNPAQPMQSDWGELLPAGSSLFLLVTLDQGLVFYLGVVGIIAWLRGRTRRGLLWASLVLSSYVLWLVNYLLYLTARARESDEFYFFLVFTLAVAAGNGAYEVARRLTSPVAAAAIRGALFLPILLALPYWWRPMEMDSHFRAAREPIHPALVQLGAWIRKGTRGADIFLASRETYPWIPALSGRRALVAEAKEIAAIQQLAAGAAFGDLQPNPLRSVDYVLWDPSLAENALLPGRAFDALPEWTQVKQEGPFRLYRRASSDPARAGR